MCFYYCLTKKNPDTLVKHNIVQAQQLEMFDDVYLNNGFTHPEMPVITDKESEKVHFFSWGLIPFWTKDITAAEKISNYTLNAKAETIFEKPSYKHAIIHNRCLVLCSGFFEWQKVKGKKYPYYVSLKNDEIFVFGGIWAEWKNPASGLSKYTYAIITVKANPLLEKIHNVKKRMPLILEPKNAKKWLKKGLTQKEIKEFFRPFNHEEMKAHTIKRFMPAKAALFNSPDVIAYYHYPELIDYMPDNAYGKQGKLF